MVEHEYAPGIWAKTEEGHPFLDMASLTSGRMGVAAALAGISLLTACGDANQGVKLAREFGRTAESFKEKTDRLADDIYASCVRNSRYYSLAASPIRDVDQARMDSLQNCDTLEKPTAQRAIDANQVVTNYIMAVGHLAGVNVKFNSDFNQLKKSLNSLLSRPGGPQFNLSSETVSQGVNILNKVFDWLATRYRNVELSKAVICTNEPLQVYLNGLTAAYKDGYINGSLAQEENNIRYYYNSLAILQAASSKAKKNAISVRDYEALNSNSYDALMGIRKQRAAAMSYIRILGHTGKANSEIANVFIKAGYSASPEQCVAYLKPSTEGGPVSYSPAKDNTKVRELNPSERIKIGQILLKYNYLIRHELDSINL